jgi:hypothetical protein
MEQPYLPTLELEKVDRFILLFLDVKTVQGYNWKKTKCELVNIMKIRNKALYLS